MSKFKSNYSHRQNGIEIMNVKKASQPQGKDRLVYPTRLRTLFCSLYFYVKPLRFPFGVQRQDLHNTIAKRSCFIHRERSNSSHIVKRSHKQTYTKVEFILFQQVSLKFKFLKKKSSLFSFFEKTLKNTIQLCRAIENS